MRIAPRRFFGEAFPTPQNDRGGRRALRHSERSMSSSAKNLREAILLLSLVIALAGCAASECARDDESSLAAPCAVWSVYPDLTHQTSLCIC